MLSLHDTRTPAGRAALAALTKTRTTPDFAALEAALPIVREVLAGGRDALARLVALHDGVALLPGELVVDPLDAPTPPVEPDFAAAFRLARRRIAAYHRHQKPRGLSFTDAAGIRFQERPVPLDSVGVYVPGGRAFYPSSLLMGVVPARVAGVPRVVVATPPRAWNGSAELRWAARELGIREVLLAGGAHGIAGLAAVARCAKIVGPGNRWVTAAKHLLSATVAVDLPAGPSEVLILASADAPPELVASDLLAQAEHDPDALPLLFTDARPLAAAVAREVERQLPSLPTSETARRSLAANGGAYLFRKIRDAACAARGVAAEHVQVIGRAAEREAGALAETAGALFRGAATPTALGDYIAGPNHVLPTGGAARSFSGLSLRDFYRFTHEVRASSRAARALAPPAALLARFEGLEAHARALEARR
ncbi:MAG TPA: histidinol dehydrogenase [Thermoanaerobaculia bacterium]|nr:histidinol dehydrogenase [Thermoanaerobaculia bacterium]